ncbi:MAG: carboxypeptidase-like regulatory domain-containing protein [Candidatus Eisenbacteria bacterium]
MHDRPIGPKSVHRANGARSIPRGLPAAALLVASMILLAACDTGTIGGPGGDEASEARALLTDSLPRVFADRDAAGYESLLHPDYRFTFVEGDAPAELPGSFWGKRTESAVVESLFACPSVTYLDFDVAVFDDTFTLLPGKTNEWDYRAIALLGAAIVRQEAGGASDTLIAPVIETYHLRTDPADGSWKVYDEIEQGPVEKGAAAAASTARWGAAKALFYEPLPPPANRTLKGIVRLDEAGATPVEGAAVEAGAETAATDAYGAFEIPGVPSSVRSFRVSHPNALPSTVTVGGGDDVFRVDVALIPLMVHEIPEDLIELDLPRAYSTMDSARYAALHDSRYRFTLLPEEVDPDDPLPYWDLGEELTIAGRMFSGWENADGRSVDRIALDLLAKTVVVDTTSYPEKPPGETWHKVTAVVDLKVVTEDPSDPEGIINFIVLSDQIFVVRPDPAIEGRYLIVRQNDRPSVNKGAGEGTHGTESSWGMVKSLFR